MEKYFLVKYTIVCGEYEFSGDTVLTLQPKESITAQVRKYFLNFYGERGCKQTKDEKRDGYYFYNAGEIAVKKIHYRQITAEQRKVLQELNVA